MPTAYAYYCFSFDKEQAGRGDFVERISEEKLMTLTLLAPFAAHYAMENLRHKTRKWYFKAWSYMSMGMHLILCLYIMCFGYDDTTKLLLTICFLIYGGMILCLPMIQISHRAAVTPAPGPTRPGPSHYRQTTGGFITQGRINNPQIKRKIGPNQVLGAPFRR